MDFHVYHHFDAPTVHPFWQHIEAQLTHLIRLGERMSVEMDALTEQVARNTQVEASAVVLIQGIAARIQAAIDAGGSPEMLTTLKNDLDSSATALGNAVAANTPAA